jgi:allantoicase
MVEVDTSYFIGNSPGAAKLTGRGADGEWIELLPHTELLADTRHRFPSESDAVISEARLDIYPDGGLARLRLFGTLA